MNEFLSGGQEHGTSITTPAAFVTPSQFPVPVGFNPAAWPNWGTREGLTPTDEGAGDGDVDASAGDGGGAGVAGGAALMPAWISCACWLKVVEAEGHPCPGPWRFCRVTIAVWMRSNWDACELSVGNDTVIAVLFTAWPARTLAFNAYI